MAVVQPPAPSPVSKVVIDTNILWSGHSLDERAVGQLAALRREKVPIVVPEVVVLELMRLLTEEDRKVQSQVDAVRRSRQAMGVDVSGWEPLTRLDWDRHVRELIRGFAMAILPYPSMSHEDLVYVSLANERPFKASGAGYRDALIWATVCEQADTRGLTVLVSNNSKDFGEGTPARTLKWNLPDDARLHVASSVDELKALIEGAPVRTDYYRNTEPPVPWPAIESLAEAEMPFYQDIDDVRIGRQVRVDAMMQDVVRWGEVWDVHDYASSDGLGSFSIVVAAEVSMTADIAREQIGQIEPDIGVSMEESEGVAHLHFQRDVHIAFDVDYRLDTQDVAQVTLVGMRYPED